MQPCSPQTPGTLYLALALLLANLEPLPWFDDTLSLPLPLQQTTHAEMSGRWQYRITSTTVSSSISSSNNSQLTQSLWRFFAVYSKLAGQAPWLWKHQESLCFRIAELSSPCFACSSCAHVLRAGARLATEVQSDFAGAFSCVWCAHTKVHLSSRTFLQRHSFWMTTWSAKSFCALIQTALSLECFSRRRNMTCLLLAWTNLRKVGTSVKFCWMFSANSSIAWSTSNRLSFTVRVSC